jgi:hypothetical protein
VLSAGRRHPHARETPGEGDWPTEGCFDCRTPQFLESMVVRLMLEVNQPEVSRPGRPIKLRKIEKAVIYQVFE